MAASIWDNSIELPSETLLEPIRKSGFYIIRDPLDGPAAGEYHVLVINATVNRVRKTYQILWSVSTGAEFFRTADNTGFGEWIERAAGEGGGSTSAALVTFNNSDSGLTATNVQNAINEVVARIITAEGDIDTQASTVDDLETLVSAIGAKLNTIEEGAEVNLTAAQIVSEIDDYLGSDAWQSGGTVEGTDIVVSVGETSVSIDSSTGSGDTIPSATPEAAGVMSAEDKTKLDALNPNANENLTGQDLIDEIDDALGYTNWKSVQDTDLGYTRDALTVTITSSTGANTTLPAADNSNAGVMTAADRVKLASIQTGAQVNPSGAAIVSAINAQLGSTEWQGAGIGDEATNATVRAVATSNVVIADLQAEYEIDGVVLDEGNLVLLVGQSVLSQNGIYQVGPSPVRPAQYDSFIELAGMIVTVQSGDEYGGSIWLCVSPDTGTIDLDDVVFERTSIAPTNLAVTRDGVEVQIHSSTGSSAVIGAASTTDAGVMAATDKTKLDSIEAGAQKTNITISRTDSVVVVESSDGTPGTIPAASTVAAGVLSALDKIKLNGIEPNATADMTPAEIVSAVNAALGSTSWQSSGSGGSGVSSTATIAVEKTDNQDIAHNNGNPVPVKCVFQAELYDSADTFEPGATSRWTPGVEGVAYLTTIINLGHARAGHAYFRGTVELHKNGTQISTRDMSSGATDNLYGAGSFLPFEFSFSDVCDVDDYYEIFVSAWAGTGAPTSSYFNGRIYPGTRVVAFVSGNGGGVDGGTDITIERDESSVTVKPSNGDAGIIGAADASNAGLMTAAQFTKLSGIEAGAQVNPTGSAIVDAIDVELAGTGWRTGATTNLNTNHSANSVEITSSTGTATIINAATSSLAGVLSASDKAKLDNIEAGAEVNPSGEDIVSAINSELGSTAWQTGGGANSADEVAFDPAGTDLVATNVQDALVELEGKIGEGGGGASDASEVTFDPSDTSLVATDVQAAIVEIDGSLSDVVSDIGVIEGKLATVEEGAQVNPTGEAIVDAIDTFLGNDSWHTASGTDLGVTPAADKVTVTSSTGDDVDIPAATGEAAGVLSAADKAKLDGIESGAEVNPDAEDILNLLDTYLGSTDWREPLVSNETGGLAAVLRVRVATVGNVAINSDLNNGDILDGVTLATGDLVLVKDQTTPSQNGIYVVGPNPVQRHIDYNSFEELPGTTVVVLQGTVNRGTIWLCDSDFGGTIGTDPVTFRKVAPTELTVAREARKLDLVNSIGDLTEIPLATQALAGLMSDWDKFCLNFPKVDTVAWTNLDLNSDISGGINGYLVGPGSIILAAGQTDPSENGIYVVGASSSTRHPEYPAGGNIHTLHNAQVRVLSGNDAGKIFKCFATSFDPIGTADLVFRAAEAKPNKVVAATTANITVNTALNPGDTIDGVVLVAGDYVLVKNQTTPSQNGIYRVAATPFRPSEYSTYPALAGSIVSVEGGTVNKGSAWLCVTANNVSPFEVVFMRVSTAAGTPLSLDVEGQEISGGASVAPKDLGTISTGTLTFDVGARPVQKIVNDGAFMLGLAAGKSGSSVLYMTNGSTAGEVNLSNFTRTVIPEGSELDTDEGSVFRFGIEVVDDISVVHVLKVV